MKRKFLLIAGSLQQLSVAQGAKSRALLMLILLIGLSVNGSPHKKVQKYPAAARKHKKAALANPTLSYNSPNTFYKGAPIKPLTPTSSGVGSLGYGSLAFIGTNTINTGEIAVDASGNVYVNNYQTGAGYSVIEIPANDGPLSVLASGFSQGGPIAVDASGNVFAVNDQTLMEIVKGSGTAVPIGDLGSFSSPSGMVIDASDDIFIGDRGGMQVKEFVGGVGPFINIGSGFYGPYGVSLDPSGNLYVVDYGNKAIKMIPAGNGPVQTLASYYYPTAITRDNSGNFFVYGAGAAYNTITEYPNGNFNNPVNFTTGTYNEESVIADNQGNLYLSAKGGIEEITEATGNRRILAAGLDNCEQVAVDAAGNVFVADAYDQSVREIPAAGSTYPITLAPNFDFAGPYGIAVDAADNVYVGEEGMIYKIAPGAATATVVCSNLNNVLCIAIDAKGNIFACEGDGNLYRVAAGSNTATIVNSHFSQLESLTLDAAGNIYGYDYNTTNIYKVAKEGADAPVAIATGISRVKYLAVDAAGNVYLTTQGNGSPSEVSEISAVTGTVTAVATTLNEGVPTGVAVDGTGNLYVADYNIPTGFVIDKFTPTGGYFINNLLPAGLIFDNTSGTITGTPLALTPPTNYTVTAWNGSGSTSDIFSIKVVAPPPLVITAKNVTIAYGAPIPTTLNVTFSGFVNGDTQNSLTTKPTVTTTATQGSNVGTYPITASGAVDPNYTITYVAGTLTIAPSANDNLSGIQLAQPYAALTATGVTTYKASVSNASATITEIATTADATATVTVNGTTVTSGSASAPIPLNVGTNVITTVVTAQSGAMKTYTITVTRAPSSNASLSSLQLENPYTQLTATTGPGYQNYTASVSNATTSVGVLAVTADPTATVTVNGGNATSGTPFIVNLTVGATPINVVVTAADGTMKNYIITVTRAPSGNANLAGIQLAHPYAALTAVTGPDDGDYTATVSAATITIDELAKTVDATATITINGTTVASNTDSPPITLAVGSTTITTVVTAQDGTTTKTFVITVTRPGSLAQADAATGNGFYGVVQTTNDLQLNSDGILVHQGLSPNGDGINDFLQIDGITNYPDNKLQIMNRDGLLVYEAKGYDNSTRVFDGHSSKNGQMQLPGTYFYSLDYIVKGVTQHKTGYIVLRY